MGFKFIETAIPEVKIIEPDVLGDARGYFMESYQQKAFAAAGIAQTFVQDNESCSKRGVLRGLHFQISHPQAKLVRVISGEIYDVAVDVRKDSPTWGQYVGVTLSSENKRQFFIPRGFAHGFLVLSELAIFAYKCDEFYHPEDEGGYRYDDPTFAIQWPDPGVSVLLSEKDRNAKLSGR